MSRPNESFDIHHTLPLLEKLVARELFPDGNPDSQSILKAARAYARTTNALCRSARTLYLAHALSVAVDFARNRHLMAGLQQWWALDKENHRHFAALRQIQLRVCEEFRAASEQFASDPILSERVTDLSRSFAEGTRMLETRSEDWTSRRENFLAEYPSAKQSPEHLSAECRDLIAFRLYKAGLENDEIAEVMDRKFAKDKRAARRRITTLLTHVKKAFSNRQPLDNPESSC